jgi:hypothetical protein
MVSSCPARDDALRPDDRAPLGTVGFDAAQVSPRARFAFELFAGAGLDRRCLRDSGPLVATRHVARGPRLGRTARIRASGQRALTPNHHGSRVLLGPRVLRAGLLRSRAGRPQCLVLPRPSPHGADREGPDARSDQRPDERRRGEAREAAHRRLAAERLARA